ncbi:Inner membrane complex protein, putative [Hepatocystis sp. ex Piliocolobus tephrosceles]|nr:Inner membrane complex protein, putative [Hepatocystis sp. ex Piliocolobus tephrosceles]
MFNDCRTKNNCCDGENEQSRQNSLSDMNMLRRINQKEGSSKQHEKKEYKKVIKDIPDLLKKVELDQRTDREYVAITAYQPVDVVTKTVEVPCLRTIETQIPKITYEDKIVEVPKYETKYVEKVIEVPEVKFIDKVVNIPNIQYSLKYVPKIEMKENIIKKPVITKKIIEKIVEVPQIKEVKRYQEFEAVEYIYK